MESEQVVERFELWQKAIRALQNGIRVRRSGYQLLMQVALLPSRPMHPATAYSLLHSSDADKAPYMLVRSTWDSEMDLARLQSEPSLPATVEPTISQTEAIVDVERARILHKSIAGLSIPLIPSKPPSGLDGTTIEVTIGDAHFSGCRIWWWVRPPEEWEAVGVLVEELIGWAG